MQNDPEKIHTLDLAHKDFKAAIMTILESVK